MSSGFHKSADLHQRPGKMVPRCELKRSFAALRQRLRGETMKRNLMILPMKPEESNLGFNFHVAVGWPDVCRVRARLPVPRLASAKAWREKIK